MGIHRPRLIALLTLALLAMTGCDKKAPMLDHPDPTRRSEAITSLTVETAPAHADEILRLLQSDPDANVRAAAIVGAGMARDVRAVPALAGYVRDTAQVDIRRMNAVNALVAIGGPEAGETMIGAYLKLPQDDGLFEHVQQAVALRHDDWYRRLETMRSTHPERVEAAVERRRASPIHRP